MKIRIKFTKTGALRYIGHLDVMRYFQKMNRRAQIPVAYSEGFSPHQILSFTPPLSLGAESVGEYADMEITEAVNSQEAICRLNQSSVEGIKILSFRALPERALNAMASVTAAKYRCSIKDDSNLPVDYISELVAMLKSNNINVVKKTKKSEKTVNIRPLIYSYDLVNDDDKSVDFLLSAGSVDNLKPELIYRALYDKLNIAMPDNCIKITRIDMYCGEADNLVSIDDVGKDRE